MASTTPFTFGSSAKARLIAMKISFGSSARPTLPVRITSVGVRQQASESIRTARRWDSRSVGGLLHGSRHTHSSSLWDRLAWGSAPSLALLFIGGAQQGMQNTFMSYHWLTGPRQVHLRFALLAVAWSSSFRGARGGVGSNSSWAGSSPAIVAFYKLHYVNASALLILLVPTPVLRGQLGSESELSRRSRHASFRQGP